MHRSRQVDELADSLHLANHAVSPIVDRLQAAGLLRRRGDGADGRVVRVELTPSGSDLEAAAGTVRDEVRCLTLLEPFDVVRLRAELVELVGRMGLS